MVLHIYVDFAWIRVVRVRTTMDLDEFPYLRWLGLFWMDLHGFASLW